MPRTHDVSRFRVGEERLAWRADPAIYSFESTEELEPIQVVVGQERGVEAIRRGLGVASRGFNVFVNGVVGSGKTTTVERLVNELAPQRPRPPDRAYVHNFEDPARPRALTLPPGTAADLKAAMQKVRDAVESGIGGVVTDEAFAKRQQAILNEAREREQHLYAEFSARADQAGFVLVPIQAGSQVRPVLMYKLGEEPVPVESLGQFVREGRLQEADADRARSTYPALADELATIEGQARQLARDTGERLQHEVEARGKAVITGTLADVRAAFPHEEVWDHLGQVQDDLLRVLHMLANGVPNPMVVLASRLALYEVNVVADRSRRTAAPVVVEHYPTHQNLFGTIEPVGAGGLQGPGDYTTVRGGSVLEADGGFLILQARDVLAEPGVWDALKRVLRTGQLEIRPGPTILPIAPMPTVKPEPLPVNVKVVLVGEPGMYPYLYAVDPDFRKTFKITADFDAVMDRTEETLQAYAHAVARICDEEGLHHLSPGAMAELVTYGARRAGGRHKIAADFSDLADVIREASYLADVAGRTVVAADDVQQALDDRRHRASLAEDRLQEAIETGTILLDTDGTQVGRVNGLSVYDLGYHRFGKPTRITASVSPGQAGIINIEREARLSGNIYDKGVLVISGWVRRCFAKDAPLAFTASLAFEQSYAGVDGDSASIAEVAALLSEIADLPVLQGIAVTGSINQHGQVQAVGGVNEKIEGFHALCGARGLTGEQGVVVPESNLLDLVLDDAATDDIRAGRFHLWAVTNVQEALEVLLDRPSDVVMTQVQAGLENLRHKTEATTARDNPPTPLVLPEPRPPLPGLGRGRGGPGTNDE